MIDVALTHPQADFVEAKEQFPAMVAGFGAGKSHAGIWRAVRLKLQYRAQNVAYYLPTYDLVTRMGMPRFCEILDGLELPYKPNKVDSTIEISGFGLIIFRTMDNPARIVAYEVADSICDELDTLPIDKARDVWNKVIARNRQKKPDGSLNTVGVATTPEGFRFVYERWKKNPGAGYRLIKATTMSNAANLPDGYIDSLRETYPPSLLAAYLDGEFVNLTSGSVYSNFNRDQHRSSERIERGEPLHIGMDFNVWNMSAVVLVLRNGLPHAVEEMIGYRDTPDMIRAIKERYQGHHISIYPDASGAAHKSVNASLSDISLLRQAGFTVLANSRNPAVKDRVMAVNLLLEKGQLLINHDRCPTLVEGLERQSYNKSGEPDKQGGFDHLNDAIGYFIVYKFGLTRSTVTLHPLSGI
jgi:hypothetical protein